MRLPLISLVLVAVGSAACASSSGTDPLAGRQNTSPPNPQDNAPPGPNDTNPPSTPPGTTPPPPGMMEPPGTWADGHTVTGNITIPAGTTVTIAAGAKVTVADSASITVAGTLKGTAGTTHADITSATTWGGIVVASGGTLQLDSVDIGNAKMALWTESGNTAATYANGTITGGQPFNMAPGSKLSLSHATVTGATAASALAGTFDASYLTYDKGTSEGLYTTDAAATVHFADSILKGNGGGDYIVVTAAQSLHVEYTTITGSHCPFHFGTGPTTYTIDHVSDDTNGYGWMLYGSGTGPNTISNSNFTDSYINIEMTGTNGKVTLTNNFFINGSAGANKLQSAATVASTATARIANAKPR
jgi:hypothetical protein